MSSGPDFYTIALAIGVIVLIGTFFCLVGSGIVMRVRQLARWHDGTAERQRAAIEHERKHGATPLWLKAIRVALVAAFVGIVGLRLWMRMSHA